MIKKAEEDRKAELSLIGQQIDVLKEEHTVIKNTIARLNQELKTAKQDERQKVIDKINEESVRHGLKVEQIDHEIEKKKIQTEERVKEIRRQKSSQLQGSGADTQRIDKVEKSLSEVTATLKSIDENKKIIFNYQQDKQELFDKEDEFLRDKDRLEKQQAKNADQYSTQARKFSEQIEAASEGMSEILDRLTAFKKDADSYINLQQQEALFEKVRPYTESFSEKKHRSTESATDLINGLYRTNNSLTEKQTLFQGSINKFAGQFREGNLFNFKTHFADTDAYYIFAETLRDFIDENKLEESKRRVEGIFADIINLVGKEIGDLLREEGEIRKVVSQINKGFGKENFVQAIKSIEIRAGGSDNGTLELLKRIKNFGEERSQSFGPLFSDEQELAGQNEKALKLLIRLKKRIEETRQQELHLSDCFKLEFKIDENNNTGKWVESLSDVGSEGTDILAKAMINVMLLSIFKTKAAGSRSSDFRLHCVIDEIGKLHPENIKGILKFANEKGLYLLNGSPVSQHAHSYKHTYLLSSQSIEDRSITSIKRLASILK